VLEVISSQRFGKHGGDELNVIKIQPNVKKSKDMPKQRVAAYCRVSTDNSGQIESLETQIKHYETYIKSNPHGCTPAFITTRAYLALKKKNATAVAHGF